MIYKRRNLGARQRKNRKPAAAQSAWRRRFSQLERLEDRTLLSGSPVDNPWHNPANPTDVNDDTNLSPLDALIVINSINKGGARELFSSSSAATGAEGESGQSNLMVDVNNDGFLSPIDVLQVVNRLNAEAEGPDLAKVRLNIAEDKAASASGRTNRASLNSPVVAGTIVRAEVFVQDVRTDTPTNGLYGTFASYEDIQYDPKVFTVQLAPSVNQTGAPKPNFAISYRNTNFNAVLDNGGTPTDPADDIMDDIPFRYPNDATGSIATPGLIDNVGSFAAINRFESKSLGQLEYFQYDIRFKVETVYAGNDLADVTEGGSVQVSVLNNDELIGKAPAATPAYTRPITVGPPETAGAGASGREFLIFGTTGTQSGSTVESYEVPSDQISFVGDNLTITNTGTKQVLAGSVGVVDQLGVGRAHEGHRRGSMPMARSATRPRSIRWCRKRTRSPTS